MNNLDNLQPVNLDMTEINLVLEALISRFIPFNTNTNFARLAEYEKRDLSLLISRLRLIQGSLHK